MKPKLNRPSGMDVCQTPPYALQPILPYIPKNALIWESACGPDMMLVNALNDLGYAVWASDIQNNPSIDFFAVTNQGVGVVQLTNPPFSQKYEWLEHSFELGPFALLLPYETTFAGKFQVLCKKYNRINEVIVHSPERRIDFKMPFKGWSGSSAQMPTCWITWGLNTPGRKPDFVTFYGNMKKEKMV